MNKMFMRRCFSSFLPSQKSFLFGQKIVSRQTVFNRGFSRVNVRHLEIAEDRKIAYKLTPGKAGPTIIHVPGLNEYTRMNGDKAMSLLRYCNINDYPCVIYDHECTGNSEGDTRNVLFSHWVEDLETVITRLTEGPIVLVGSSLGGWLALSVAKHHSHLIHGMILFSPAINYVWKYYEKHLDSLPKHVATRLKEGDIHVHTHEFGDALLKKDFAEDSRKHEIDLEQPIKIDCPVRIVHGMEDDEIKPDDLLKLVKNIKSNDVDLLFRKNGDHQLEAPEDMELFMNTIDRLMKDYPVRSIGILRD